MTSAPTRIAVSAWLALLLCACRPDGVSGDSALERLDVGTAEGFAAAHQAGVVPFEARVRAINELGAAVASPDREVTVDGEATTLSFDANGVAVVTFEDPGRHVITLPAGEEVIVYAHDAAWEGYGLDEAGAGFPGAEHAFPLNDGHLVASPTEIWWRPFDRAAERVLSLSVNGGIRGMVVEKLDADGHHDVLAWNSDTLFFLRGLDEGGFGWVKALRVAEGTLGGVAVEDLDDDGVMDLAVGVHGTEDAWVELLLGDGLFDYDLSRRIDLKSPPRSIALDVDGTTGVQRLIAVGDGTWEWLEELDEDGFVLRSSDPPLEIPEAATLLDGGDFSGDLVDEAWLVGPRLSGQGRSVHVINTETRPLSYSVRNPVAAHLAFQDFQRDGQVDLWSLDDTATLRFFTGANGVQEERNLGELVTTGPIVAEDVDGDDVPELFIAGPSRAHLYKGAVSDSGNWRAAATVLDRWLVGMQDMWALDNFDGDDQTADWVGLQVQNDVPWLKRWTREYSQSTVIQRGRYQVAETIDDVVAADVCGNDLWFLTRDRLVRIDMSDMTEAVSLDVTGASVACWGGASRGVGVLRAGEVDLYDVDATYLSTVSAGSAQAVDAVDTVGDELTPVLGYCETASCTVAAWPTGDDVIFVTSDEDGVRWEGMDPMHAGLVGMPHVADVDADGLDDLLTVDESGVVTVVRATPDGPGEMRMFYLQRGLLGGVMLADDDGDGQGELVVIDDVGNVLLVPTVAQ